jgi:hypothetical protein
MQDYIPGSVEEDDRLTQEVIYKIVHAHPVPTKSTEPGVEVIHGLAPIIDTIIREAVTLNYDFIKICQGIVMGAFRCDLSIPLEAHKTLRLLIRHIIQSAYKYNADTINVIKGTMIGVIGSSKEHKLNIQEAVAISKEDILCALDKTGTGIDGTSWDEFLKQFEVEYLCHK